MSVFTRTYQRYCLSVSIVLLSVLPSLFLAVPPVHAAHDEQLTNSAATAWWNTQFAFRVAIQVNAAGYSRSDYPAEVELNFTTIINHAGQSAPLDSQSLRLVEVAGDRVIDDQVPFQFDAVSGYDATTNARGTLVFILSGATAANTTRTYHLYFNSHSANGVLPVTFPPQVTVTTTNDEGQAALQIQTAQATYIYQKAAGGFSSLLDAAGADWLNYHPTPAASAGGAYRGIPNMVHPEGGLHPGANGFTTAVRNTGPLKITIHTVGNTDSDGAQWEIRWEFFPTFARATVLAIDHNYWFLYEGTPGGSFDPNQDFVVRANGTKTAAAESWTADLPGEEWLYFADPQSNRALYLVSHTEDNVVDSYRPMSDKGGAMTVFGFGRQGGKTLLSDTGHVFTIGLVDSTAHGTVAPYVRGIYRPLTLTVGALEQYGTNPAGQITIALSAQPKAKRNFRFDGDLGVFRLDDPKVDDGDAYAGSRSVTTSDGVYTVRQSAVSGWHLSAISCLPASDAIINLTNRTAAITARAGQRVDCTFVTVKNGTLRVQRLDGRSNQTVILYGADGAIVDSGQSNQYGKLSFTSVQPGIYSLCTAGDQACTAVATTNEEVTLVTLPTVGDVATITTIPLTEEALDGTVEEDEDALGTEESSDNWADSVTGDVQLQGLSGEEAWLNTPILSYQLYLPLVSSPTDGQ